MAGFANGEASFGGTPKEEGGNNKKSVLVGGMLVSAELGMGDGGGKGRLVGGNTIGSIAVFCTIGGGVGRGKVAMAIGCIATVGGGGGEEAGKAVVCC